MDLTREQPPGVFMIVQPSRVLKSKDVTIK